MHTLVLEKDYPISFREKDALTLGGYIKNRQNVVLVGMKRVGISNFLRFFLYHDATITTYVETDNKHVFIPVDLNDLVEREIFPFWVLTLKRICDASQNLSLPAKTQERIDAIFLTSIQSQDTFIVIDSIKHVLQLIIALGFLPTLFFLRFDRVKDALPANFFANLQGLIDASHHKLCVVFTSYRRLDSLAPAIFPKADLTVFCRDVYLQPAKEEDMKVIYETYAKKYDMQLASDYLTALLAATDGYVQYLQLALLVLKEKQPDTADNERILDILLHDERIMLQSEELWESLSKTEQDTLIKIVSRKNITDDEKSNASYIWNTGIVHEETIFSPLFAHYIQIRQIDKPAAENVEYTKKENALLRLLEEHKGEICEREMIIEKVWAEVEPFGVSDWAIDRLVGRVRSKLKHMNAPFEIKTIRTRGYKLVDSEKSSV